MCNTNDNHMMYSSWDIKHGRQNLLSFWAIFCPFTPQHSEKSKFWKNEKNVWRYYHSTLVYHKLQSCDVWFLRYGAWQTEFFVILDYFLPFYPPNNLKNQQMKKTSRDIIMLHICTINENHMMYGSWDVEHDRQIFFSLLTIFCPFTPPPPNNTENQKFWKDEKTTGDIIILHKCNINDNYMMYDSWNMKHDRQNFLSFWAIFALLAY